LTLKPVFLAATLAGIDFSKCGLSASTISSCSGFVGRPAS